MAAAHRQASSLNHSPVHWLAAIDVGSSAVKCVAWDRHDPNQLIQVASAATPTRRDGNGAVEVDANQVIEICLEQLRSLADLSRRHGATVTHLGITSQIGGVLCLDARDQPVTPLITWADRRADEQAGRFFDQFADRLPGWLGHVLPRNTCWTAPKIAWLVQHRPDIAARTAWFGQIKDHLFKCLTGQCLTDPLTLMGMTDVKQGRYVEPILAWCGIEATQLPRVVDASTLAPAGPVLREIFSPDHAPQVSVGTADMRAAFLGFNLHRDEGFLQAGTTEILGCALTDRATCPEDPVVTLPYHAGLSITYGSMSSGASLLAWLESIIGRYDIDELSRQAAEIPPGCDGLLMVPYLQGARAPLWKADARGALLGLSLRHGPAHLLRAVMEACAFAERHVLESIGPQASWRPQLIKIAGGTTNNPLWNTIRTAVLGCVLRVMPACEFSALGAAALTLGDEAKDWLDRYHRDAPATIIEPTHTMARAYEPRYRAYLKHTHAMTGNEGAT